MISNRLLLFSVTKPLLLGITFTLLVTSKQAASSHVAVQLIGDVAVTRSTQQLTPEAANLIEQGKKLYQSGQFYQAAKVWQQAVQAFQAEENVLNRATALSLLSLAYQQLGQWSQANQAIANSLQLLPAKTSDTTNLPVLAQALNIKGQLQLSQGQAQLALTTWQQATATYNQIGDRAGVTGSTINQVQALQTLGRYRQAEKLTTQLEQTLQTQPNSAMKAMGLRSLGNTLRVIGNLDHSRQVLQQSLAVAQQVQSSTDVSAALLSLGNTLRTQPDHQATALKLYQQAATASTSPITQTQAQLNQLSLLIETQQWSAAQALLPAIQAQLTNFSPSRTSIYAQINLAQSLMKLRAKNWEQEQADNQQSVAATTIGKLLATAVQQAKSIKDQRAEAYALGQLGSLYEQIQQWSHAQDLTQQALILAQAINASDIAYRWQWQLGRLHQAQGNSPAAIAAYTETVKTLQSLRNDLVAINPEVQFSFREEVEPVYRQLVDLLLQSEPTSEPSQANLQQARAAIEALQLAELDNFFRVACLEGRPVQVDQVIDREDPTAAVIYPIILPDRLEVILKLPQQNLRRYQIPVAQAEVESTLEQLRQNLTKPYTLKTTKSLSQQVYDWLIRPAEADLGQHKVKTLVFVLDGALRNIPMASLYDGQQYLVQKYGVALTPGLQLLAPKAIARGQLKTLSAGLTEAREGFAALTNVALELNQIKSEVPSTVLLNQQFTSTTLQQQIDSVPFPVVHLATHGQFSSQADQTFILAWDKPIVVNELNQLLRARDTSNSNAIELLVLSACQTATGDKRAALGLAGVAVRAGARSTLASLWSLDDESSAVLMSQFYRELAQSTVTKAEALRLAQLALLQNPRYQHPRYWAPYVLVGNWL